MILLNSSSSSTSRWMYKRGKQNDCLFWVTKPPTQIKRNKNEIIMLSPGFIFSEVGVFPPPPPPPPQLDTLHRVTASPISLGVLVISSCSSSRRWNEMVKKIQNNKWSVHWSGTAISAIVLVQLPRKPQIRYRTNYQCRLSCVPWPGCRWHCWPVDEFSGSNDLFGGASIGGRPCLRLSTWVDPAALGCWHNRFWLYSCKYTKEGLIINGPMARC